MDERAQPGETPERQEAAPDSGADGAPAPSEPPDGGGEAATADGSDAEQVSADLQSLLDDAQQQRDEYLELARRARADFENYRRRVSADAAEAERRGRAALAKEVLPALDNLERALGAAGVDPDGAPPEGEPASREVSAHTALAEGVALVLRELRVGLERAGVSGFDPLGESFDPQLHEAVATAPAPAEQGSGVVLETLQSGYRVGEQVLRPARVVVSE
jgi:molecular chaperone GrpE